MAISDDGTSVTVRMDKPELNLETSYVVIHDKGLITKFEGSDLERRAQLQAIVQMRAAAEDEGQLIDLAEKNTTTMLRGLLGSLGYDKITVAFDGY